ncbi:MAG: response regulator [Geobacteraceae bacterium]|nr:MAG: response regulator [Geobacteraceae bacterium]
MAEPANERELWILGLGERDERGAIVRGYLAEAGYCTRPATVAELAEGRPLGVLLDLSPYSADGWGILLDIKNNRATRDIPVLPLYLSEEGKVGGIFPVAGFFTLPVDEDYLIERLAVLGLIEDAEDYDLQALVVSRKGEEKVAKALESLGFEVVNAYTGKEAVALATIGRQYLIFCTLMLPDTPSFELVERFRLYPQTRNIPFFVLIKDAMKEGERNALSREIEHLVRKKELSKEEFLGYFRRRA